MLPGNTTKAATKQEEDRRSVVGGVRYGEMHLVPNHVSEAWRGNAKYRRLEDAIL